MTSGEAWTALHVDDIEGVDWRRTGLTWLPLRPALGVDIVGIGAFVARSPGQPVIEPHTEARDGRGHQEVYIVISGAARFRVDGDDVEAPSGTLLKVEAEAHREAVATAEDTIVLALGGAPSFHPSASEWIERARPHVRSDPARALAILDDLRRNMPGDRANAVGEAMLAVGRGDQAQARAIVERLVAEAPAIRNVLRTDPDLAPLLPDERTD